MPLPFLKATDCAPLALLGNDHGASTSSEIYVSKGDRTTGRPFGGCLTRVHFPVRGLRSLIPNPVCLQTWEEALKDMIVEDYSDDSLPQTVFHQVANSPALLNLAISLAHHRRLYLTQTEAPPRVREHLWRKSSEIAMVLRTILCV